MPYSEMIGSIDLENHPVKQISQICLAETQSIHLNKKTGRLQNAGRGGRSNYYCSIADGVCGGAATTVYLRLVLSAGLNSSVNKPLDTAILNLLVQRTLLSLICWMLTSCSSLGFRTKDVAKHGTCHRVYGSILFCDLRFCISSCCGRERYKL
jgi:hypothetical protein